MTGLTDPIPTHVPPERIVDVDIYRVPGPGEDLHSAWKRLQDSTPFGVLWTPRNGGHWLATRGRYISRIYADYENYSSNVTIVPREIGERFPLRPTTLDPPLHRPYRKQISATLTMALVRSAEPRIRSLAREAVEAVRLKGSCEFIREVVEPIPARLFMHLAGLPEECSADLPRYGEDPEATPVPVMERFAAFLRPIIAERRCRPENDLLSDLINGQVDGRPLTEDEAVDIATAVLTGGLDTVVSSAGFMMAFLAGSRPHRQRLICDPGIFPSAVSEMLRRFPLMTKARLIKRDQKLDGIHLRAGDMIVLPPLHGLDEQEFDDPMRVDFDRPKAPNSVFGNGVHHCPGHLLAQSELAILLETWLAAVPEFEINPRRLPRMRSGILGAMEELALQWDPASTCCAGPVGIQA